MPALYIVEEAADCEGRTMRFKAAFTTLVCAEKLRAKLGGYGRIVTASYFRSYDEYEISHANELRQKALAKLSADERAVLGLD